MGAGLREQDISFGIAALLKPLLEAAGHEVRLTRETQQTSLGRTENESLVKRCRPTNDWGAALFVSLHCNAHTNASACGTEVYSYRSGSEAARYAQRIQKAVTARLGTAERGAKTYGYYVLRHTSCPAVLVETAFITNAADNTLLRTRQADFAKAIYEGITGEAYENEGAIDINYAEKIAHLEESLKSAHKRIDGVSALTQPVYELASSIKTMQHDITDMSGRIKDIEEKPGNRRDLVVTAIVTTLVGAVIRYLFKEIVTYVLPTKGKYSVFLRI